MSTATLDRPEVIDEATFGEIWQAYAGDIQRGYLYPRVGDAAEDLCQDVFLRAWTKRDQYDPNRGPIRAWLYTIASSVVADHWRATGRRPATTGLPDGFEVTDDTDIAAQACDHTEVTTALAAVPARDRELLARRYLADQPVADVAQDLDMPVGTVKSRSHKALAALRTALGVVAPVAPRTPRPKRPVLAAVEPAPQATPADVPDPTPTTRSPVDHRVPARRPRRGRSLHRRTRRTPRPAHLRGTPHPPRHPTTTGPADGRRRPPGRRPVHRSAGAGPQPGRRNADRPALEVHRRRPGPGPGLRPLHQRHQGGDQPMSRYEIPLAWIPDAAVALMLLGLAVLTWLMLGERAAYADTRPAGRAWHLSLWQSLRLAAAVATRQAFLPEAPTAPALPDDDEAAGEPDPLDEDPEPAPAARQWPVPVIERVEPTPVEAALFHATGEYPTYPEWATHSGMTGAIPRILADIPAGVR